jgi:hypothetical protein
MKRKEYTEEKEGAKERFDRAMKTIFSASKKGKPTAEKKQQDASSQQDDQSADRD